MRLVKLDSAKLQAYGSGHLPQVQSRPATVQWPMENFNLGDPSEYVMDKIVAHLNDLNERIQTIEDTIGLALDDDVEYD